MVFERCVFESYDHCYDTLIRLKMNPSEARELVDHEKEHFDRALALGYTPIYVCYILADTIPSIIGMTDFVGRVPEGLDMIDILMAPSQPSEDDIALATKIRSLLQSSCPSHNHLYPTNGPILLSPQQRYTYR